MLSKTYIVYHKDCLDGFTAAWAAYRHYGNRAIYIPLNYSDPVPNFESNSEILILDFSFKPEILNRLTWEHTVVLLDHHKSAMEACNKYFGETTIHIEKTHNIRFDMTKSGARLAWEHFNTGAIPDIIKYVEDRDLWKFTFPQTKVFHAYLCSRNMTFENWNKIHENMTNVQERAKIFFAGSVVLNYIEQEVLKITQEVKFQIIGGYNVPVINCPFFLASEVCHVLLNKFNEVPFVASYYDGQNFRKWSLRSKDFDVAKIAIQYGGGGHKHASGFEEFYG